jgi:hypothetical protein
MGAVNRSQKSREKGRVLEFETKERKMSWLEKSAGIIMSEIILGNAGVCCKGPGKRQFITSLGPDTQPTCTHRHRHSHHEAILPALDVVGRLQAEKAVLAWQGGSSDRRVKKARSPGPPYSGVRL